MIALLLATALAQDASLSLHCSSGIALVGPTQSENLAQKMAIVPEQPVSIRSNGRQLVMTGDTHNPDRVRELNPDAKVEVDGEHVVVTDVLSPAMGVFFGPADAVDLHGFGEPVPVGCSVGAVFSTVPLALQAQAQGKALPELSPHMGMGFRWGDETERLTVAFFADELLPSEDFAQILKGRPARRPALGHSASPPTMAFRLNTDALAALRFILAQDERFEEDEVNEAMNALDDTGVRFHAGTEIGMFGKPQDEDDYDIVVIAPLKRPHSGARLSALLLKQLAKDPSLGHVQGDLFVFDRGGSPFYVGAGERTIILGSSAKRVQEQLVGAGTPWFTAEEDLREPGVALTADLTKPPFADDPRMAGLEVLHARVWSHGTDNLWGTLEVPGFVEWLARSVREQAGARGGMPQVEE